MRLPTRLSVALIVGVLATTAACGDSSTSPPPHPPAAGTLAQHFDTLYQQAKASSMSDANYNFRSLILSDLELGAAYGAPTTITVTTSAGTEQWKGFVVEEVMNDDAPHRTRSTSSQPIATRWCTRRSFRTCWEVA